ncbi:MAG: DUF2917 domain-containing protein [Pseudomonadota bacterium]
MSASDTPTVLQLRDGQTLRCADQGAVWLSVVRGRVWITRANDPDDYFLESGQSMRLAAGSQALLSAEGAAQVTLLEQPARRSRRRAGATMQAPPPRLCTDP